jgi:hypothetical protein
MHSRSLRAPSLAFFGMALLSACAPESPGGGTGSGGQPGASGGATVPGSGGSANGTGGASNGTGGSAAGTGGAGTGGSSSGTGGSPAATGGASAGTGGSGQAGSTVGTGGRGTAGAGVGGGASGGRNGTAGSGAPGTGGAAGTTGAGGSSLPPVMDYSALGPFATTTQSNTGPSNKYTIVRPSMLGQNGLLHAPVTFGPGIGMTPNQLIGLITRIASHGFVVISTQLDGGPNAASNRTAMTDGLNWIIQQNTAAGSVFLGKLDVKHAVAMGYSVGATAAVEVGSHEAIATTVAIHGHTASSALHGPLLCLGGTKDVKSDGQLYVYPSYEMSKVQSFLGTVNGADHGYIQTTVNGVPGGVETPALIAWIRYWIYNDQGAKKYFYGDDCVMCKAPWTNPQRKNWQ